MLCRHGFHSLCFWSTFNIDIEATSTQLSLVILCGVIFVCFHLCFMFCPYVVVIVVVVVFVVVIVVFVVVFVVGPVLLFWIFVVLLF